MPAWARRALRLAAAPVLVYLLVCVAMALGQRQLQYHPDPTVVAPQTLGLATAQTLTLSTADGQRLVAWWIAPASPREPVFLYLHGNGGQLGQRARRLSALAGSGAGVLAVSWRGYGGSSGAPTEAGLLADAQAGWAELRRRAPGNPALVFGESLGTTVAVRLVAALNRTETEAPAARSAEPAGHAPAGRPVALVLDSSFDSALAVARGAYPWLPVGLLLQDTYRADLDAPAVTQPVLQVHCAEDPVTPLANARALNGLLPAARPLHLIDGRCHIVPLAQWRAVLDAFVGEVMLPTRVAGVGVR